MKEKPTSIKFVAYLTIFKIALSWIFYAIFAFKLENPGMANKILFTVLGYMVLAGPMLYFTHKRNALGTRIFLVLSIIVSLPIKAFIGILLDGIAFGLTYRSVAKEYFETTVLRDKAASS